MVGETSLGPRLYIVLESKLESADQAESLLRKFSLEMGYGDDQREQIALAVREAVVNAVFHGNRCDPGKKVFLTAERQGHGPIVAPGALTLKGRLPLACGTPTR